MGRHTIVNPKTGRRVYKTGQIGRSITKKTRKSTNIKGATKNASKPKKLTSDGLTKKKNNTKNKTKNNKTLIKTTNKQPKTPTKKKTGGGAIKDKFYGYAGATQNASPLFKNAGKTNNFATRPSARACFDQKGPYQVAYAGKIHCMAFRSNGSPYWKVCG